MSTNQFLRTAAFAILTMLFVMPQHAGAQSLGNFNKALKKERAFGKPYWFDKESGVNEEKSNRIARENNFVITENEGGRVKFVPKSEYDAYIAERDFTQRSLYYDANNKWHSDYYLSRGNNYYDLSSNAEGKFFYDWYNKQLKGSDFKSTGSAWLYEGGKMIKVDNLHWTGAVKNGMLDGRGDGYIVREENGHKTYRSFSGGFAYGFPNGEMHMLKSTYYKPGEKGHPFDQSTEAYTVGNFSDGMASLSFTVKVAGGWGGGFKEQKVCGFIDQQGNLAIPCMYDEVKKDFANGVATVKFKDYDIVINKRNKCVEFPPNQNQNSRGVIGRGYFTDAVFSELKQLTIPPTIRIVTGAFASMKNLEEVTFTEGLQSIDSKAFEGCSRLKSATLPNSIRELGENVFDGCWSLTSVSVPQTLTWKNAQLTFLGCNNLKAVTIRNADGTTTQDANWLQRDKDLLATLHERWAEENRKDKERATERASSTQRANDVTYTITKQTDWVEHRPSSFSKVDYYVKTIYFSDGIYADVYRYPDKNGYRTQTDWRYETLSDAIAAAYAYAKFGGERTKGRIY